jgi:hypothetical protein
VLRLVQISARSVTFMADCDNVLQFIITRGNKIEEAFRRVLTVVYNTQNHSVLAETGNVIIYKSYPRNRPRRPIGL